jgi:hypothetical protein
LELTSRSKGIAFTDDLTILTTGQTVAGAENCLNLEQENTGVGSK